MCGRGFIQMNMYLIFVYMVDSDKKKSLGMAET